MPSYAELSEKATTSILDAVKPVEELTATVVSAVDRIASKLPSLPLPQSLPTASEVVAANFAAAQRVLNAQQEFVLTLAAAAPGPISVIPKQAEPKVTAKA